MIPTVLALLPGIANLIYQVFVCWRVATNKWCTKTEFIPIVYKSVLHFSIVSSQSEEIQNNLTAWLSVFLITMQMKSCLLFAGYNRNHMHCIILYIIITVTWSQELTRLDHHAGQSGSKRMCGFWPYDLCLASGFSDQAILPWWCENKKNFLFLISRYLTTFSTEQKPFEKKSFKTHL